MVGHIRQRFVFITLISSRQCKSVLKLRQPLTRRKFKRVEDNIEDEIKHYLVAVLTIRLDQAVFASTSCDGKKKKFMENIRRLLPGTWAS
jgi:hypothetical protein